ncbi:MAG TPA: DUF6498-containing protein [Candidatus Saccharimonadales bacterium]|nr:DUF6498-containing protein [Candidatus Saccharimonadales bacterium]
MSNRTNYLIKFPSLMVLLVVNLIPVYQILFLHLDVYKIIMIYWVELLIVSFFTCLKMVKTPTEGNYSENGTFVDKSAPFFIIVFSFLIYFFILIYSYNLGDNQQHRIQTSGLIFAIKDSFSIMLIPFIAFFCSHFFSYLVNFIGNKEYEKTTKAKLASIPIKNFLYLFAFIFTGIDIVRLLNLQTTLIFILIVLKISSDVYFHMGEHFKNSET